jgi:predicted nucleotidyltransferase
VVTLERAGEYRDVVRSVVAWADACPDISGVAVVGSWARDEPRMDSDLDLVVLTTDKQRYLSDGSWVADALGDEAEIVRTQDWGQLTERRIATASGFEVELGFVDPSWAVTEPLDAGTRSVVCNGCLVLHDPVGAFERLTAAIHAT